MFFWQRGRIPDQLWWLRECADVVNAVGAVGAVDAFIINVISWCSDRIHRDLCSHLSIGNSQFS